MLVSEVPCASAVALITLLQKHDVYPPPIAMLDQNDLISDLTTQFVIPWVNVLQEEQNHIQNKCLQSDVDYDFVIDSSGSVGAEYWNITMHIIGNYGIKSNILPMGSKTCGNHIAGRWFSDSTRRFYDLEPPERSEFHPETYPIFVGEKFIDEPFHKGGTDTAKALKAVREEDVPTEGLEKYLTFEHFQFSNKTVMIISQPYLKVVVTVYLFTQCYLLTVGQVWVQMLVKKLQNYMMRSKECTWLE